jgi:AcrR family transcriptional regulator
MTAAERLDPADRILDAAQRLVLQSGARRLSLTQVAKLAGVARPTLYRYFVSKDELIDALGKREYRRFNTAMSAALSGRSGVERLEAAIDLVVAFLQVQPPRHLVDLEPGFVNEQMARVLPMVTAVLDGSVYSDGLPAVAAPRDLAGALARTALSHYIFPDSDPAAARRHIRAAAGLPGRGHRRA